MSNTDLNKVPSSAPLPLNFPIAKSLIVPVFKQFTVKVRHNRNFKLIPKLNGFAPALSSKGGFTEVNIYKDEDLLEGLRAKLTKKYIVNRKINPSSHQKECVYFREV